jgi:CcmD family protein
MRRAVLAMTMLAVSAAPALAQQFEKVERIQREEIPAARFVAIAYGIIWLAILAYVLFVAGGLRRVNDEIADLKRRLRSKG